MLKGLSFRIDPTKLVPTKEMRAKLEQVDFGYENRKKISWEDAIRKGYEYLAQELHSGFVQVRLQDLDIKIKNNEEQTIAAKSRLANLNAASEASQKGAIEKEIKQLSVEKQKLLKNKTELEKSKVQEIQQGSDRLYNNTWGWIRDSHTTSTKVDFGELAHQMFNASPEKREMICSEFVASCTASVIDRLNRSLQGYLPGEKTIIKNPIPPNENFYRLHPERLFSLLNAAHCITPVRNTFLDAIVDTKSTKKSASIDLHAVVLLDIASIFDKAKDKDEFVDKAQKIMRAYLKASDIELPNSQEVKGLFEACYDEGKKEPSKRLNAFKALFVKVLRFLHVKSQKTETKATIAAKLEEIERTSRISHLAKTKSVQVTITPGSKSPGATPQVGY